jgi:hypothetical protein
MSALGPYVAPLLALLGTLLVAAIGFYQWRKQASSQSRSAIAETRRKAAEAIWGKLEEVNVALRDVHSINHTKLQTLEKEVNSTFLKNSLYLDDETQRLVSAYIKSLFRVSSLLRGGDPGIAEQWATTVWPVASDDRELTEALADARLKRSRVKHALLESTGA